MNMIVPERGIPKEDLAKIKKQCFPQTSFWVTETRTGDELTQEGGVLVSFLTVMHAILASAILYSSKWVNLCSASCLEAVCILCTGMAMHKGFGWRYRRVMGRASHEGTAFAPRPQEMRRLMGLWEDKDTAIFDLNSASLGAGC